MVTVGINTANNIKDITRNHYNVTSSNYKEFDNEFNGGEWTGETFELITNSETDFGVIIGDNNEFGWGSTPTIAWRFRIEDGNIVAYRSQEILGFGSGDYRQQNRASAYNQIKYDEPADNKNSGMVRIEDDQAEIAKMLLITAKETGEEESKFYDSAKQFLNKHYKSLVDEYNSSETKETKDEYAKKISEFLKNYGRAFKSRAEEDIFSSGAIPSRTNIAKSPENIPETLKLEQDYFNLFSDIQTLVGTHIKLAEASKQNIESILDELKSSGVSRELINYAKDLVPGFLEDAKLEDKEIKTLLSHILTEQAKAKAPGTLVEDNEKISAIKKMLNTKDGSLSKDAIIKQDGNKVYLIEPKTENFSYRIKIIEVSNNGELKLGQVENYQNLKFDDIAGITLTSPKSHNHAQEIGKLSTEIKTATENLPYGRTDRKSALDEIQRKINSREALLKTAIEDAVLEHKVLLEINPDVETEVLETNIKALLTAQGLEVTDSLNLGSITAFLGKSPIKKEDFNTTITELLKSNNLYSDSIIDKINKEAATELPEIINYFSELISPRSGTAASPYVKELTEKIMLQIGTKQVPSQRLISELRQATKLPANFDQDLKKLIKESQKETTKIYLPAFSHDPKLKEAMQIVNAAIDDEAENQNLAEFIKLYNSTEIPQELASKHKALIDKLRDSGINEPKTIRQALLAYYLASERSATKNQPEPLSAAYSHSSAEALEYKSLQGKNFDMEKFFERFQKEPELKKAVYNALNDSNFTQDPDLSARMAVLFDTLFNPENKNIYQGLNSDNLEYQKSLKEFAEKYLGFFAENNRSFTSASRAKNYEINNTALNNFIDYNSPKRAGGNYTKLRSLMSELGLLKNTSQLVSQLDPNNYEHPNVIQNLKNRFIELTKNPDKELSHQELFDILFVHGYTNGTDVDIEKIQKDIKTKLDNFLGKTFVEVQNSPAAFYEKAQDEIERFARIRNILGAENLTEKDSSNQAITVEEMAKTVSYFIDFLAEQEQKYDTPSITQTSNSRTSTEVKASSGSNRHLSYTNLGRRDFDWSQVIDDTYSTKKNFADEFRLLA